MPTKTFIEAVRDTLADEMRRDESVIVLGEDVGKKGGVFLATDGLWAEFGDDRVIDVVPSYETGSHLVSLSVSLTDGVRLDEGQYRVIVRGNTSIHDLSGLKLGDPLAALRRGRSRKVA